MELRTKLLIAYLDQLEKEGKWNKGTDIIRAILDDIKVMEAAASAL